MYKIFMKIRLRRLK